MATKFIAYLQGGSNRYCLIIVAKANINFVVFVNLYGKKYRFIHGGDDDDDDVDDICCVIKQHNLIT